LLVTRPGASSDPLARPFEADRRADPTVTAVGEAARGGEIGAIERGGPHLHQHLVGLRSRLRYVAQREPVFSRNGSLHLVLRRLLPRAQGRTQAGPLMPRARASSSETSASWIDPSPSKSFTRRSAPQST